MILFFLRLICLQNGNSYKFDKLKIGAMDITFYLHFYILCRARLNAGHLMVLRLIP